jgi:glycosyltransferase involved in cell wall biosynthesis
VDFSQVVPQIPKDIKDKEVSAFLLCVAQHRKNKNLDLLVQSYFQLRKNNQLSAVTKLVIVGSNGPETDSISELIGNLDLAGHVFLLSSISDEELRWMYENCQLFAIPSSTEGFCLPLAEAIYLDCKVVCSDIPIFREIGSSDCTYFSLKEDPVNNLAEAIAQTIEQSYLIPKSGDYRFTKSSAAEQYLKFYSTVITGASEIT